MAKFTSNDPWLVRSPEFITSSGALKRNVPVTVYKAADQSLTDSTLVNDTHLQVALASAAWYRVVAHFSVTGSGSSNRPAYAFTVPTGANLRGLFGGNEGSSWIVQTVTEASSFGPDVDGSAQPRAALFQGFVETSAAAGTLAFQLRQIGADASVTTIHAGSWMTVQRMSS